MPRCLASDRISIGSLEDDQFYSAPTSRVASRHVSVVPPTHSLEDEKNSNARPSEPLVSVCHPDSESEPLRSMPSQESPGAGPLNSKSDAHNGTEGAGIHMPDPQPISRHRKNERLKSKVNQILAEKSLNSTVKSTPAGIAATPRNPICSYTPSSITARRWSSIYMDHDRSLPDNGIAQPYRSSQIPGSTAMHEHEIDGIVRNIRAYLSGRRHECLAHTLGENQVPPSRGRPDDGPTQNTRVRPLGREKDSYLVTTNDIAGILDIVMSGIGGMQNDGLALPCLSVLLPKEPATKPWPHRKAIYPAVSVIADPATTIDSGGDTINIGPLRTTFISRQSITEVN
ncbi:hypothetical protein F4778DRAFT_545300 [Xylariomycetidae sp. FL2044]|nr:hypothetical protein F4778DRAFT_545300 [Xylariomycetidae sp. FL2044]